MTASLRPRLVYVAPVTWSSFAQRPHQFVRWWHNTTGGPVLWLDPYPSRLPRWSDAHRLRLPAQTGDPSSPHWLQRLHPPTWPIEPVPGAALLQRWLWRHLLDQVRQFVAPGGAELVVGKPSRLALLLARSGTFAHRCYDAMDDFPAFHQGRAARLMAQTEQALLSRVDCVTASSSALVTKFAARHANVIAVLNGFDLQALPVTSSRGTPPERPVLGYVGTLREWFDWSLLCQLAHVIPQATVRLIGPMDTPAPSGLPANVQCWPACSHPVAMQQMAQFTAGLIPFKLNALTASVDPIKYYEYAALGVPVLSTLFGEMRHRSRSDGVFHLEACTDLASTVHTALSWQPEADRLSRFRQQHNWAARFASTRFAGRASQPAPPG